MKSLFVLVSLDLSNHATAFYAVFVNRESDS